MPRIFLSPPHMCGTEQQLVEKAFASNFIAPLGPMVNAFEQEFCERLGHKHALALSSGTAAMHLAMRLKGVTQGSIVLASTLTFIGSVTPALFQGAELVFVDCDEESWCMDPQLLRHSIETLEAEGRKVAAVVPTDLYGQAVDLDPMAEVCREHDIPLLQDCAESAGSSYKGRPVGHGADTSIFSFNGNKIITSSGGGMLCSSDGELIDKARFLSTQARDPEPYYQHTEWGYNYRMSNIVAAIGLGQLRILPERVATRRTIFERYRADLSDVPGISFMPEASWSGHNRWLSVIRIDPAGYGKDYESLRQYLESFDIESRPVWKPMHMQPVFAGCRVFGGEVAERIFADGLCLPSGSSLSESDQNLIIELIRGFPSNQ